MGSSVAGVALEFLAVSCLAPTPGKGLGTGWCWGDETFYYTRRECCSAGSRCFSRDFLTPTGGLVAGRPWGVFNHAKCCEWSPNRSSFYGFVNPKHYLVQVTNYSRHAGLYLPGYARGDPTERSWAESREWCDKLAGSCSGFTCNEAESACSVRGGGTLAKSPFGEVSYRKDSATDEFLQLVLEKMALRLPAKGAPPVWTLVHSDSELPRQVAWEVERFRAHEERFLAVFEERRMRHRHGREPCHRQFEDQQLFVLDTTSLVIHLKRVFGWPNTYESRFVNLGANDGIGDDPLGTMLKHMPRAWAVAVERDPAMCTLHKANLPHVNLWCGAVTPANAWEPLDAWLPEEDEDLWSEHVLRLALLKVDIDSYDCALLEAYLAGTYSSRVGAVLRLQPSILLTEVNDGIPPPIQQALLFHPALLNLSLESAQCSGNIPLAGCSLSYQVVQLARFGYSLLMYAAGNAVFAHKSVMPQLAKAGIRGPVDEFECYWHTLVSAQCVSGRQLRRWFHEAPSSVWEVLAEVWEHLKSLEQHFNLPSLPMTLRV